MNIKIPSYSITISSDETILINVGSRVSIFCINETSLDVINHFRALKNPSRAILSTNKEITAYNNTLGHIAVHDVKKGNIILKSKCLSKEGYGIYFSNNDKLIISSEWFGSVFGLEIASGMTNILNSFPLSNSTNLVPITDKDFIVLGSTLTGETSAYQFSIGENMDTDVQLFFSHSYRLQSNIFACCEDEIIFYGEHINNSSNEWLTDNIAENSLFLYNTVTKKFCMFINIQQLLGITGSLHLDYGYITCMCASKNKQYILVGYSKSILIIDWINKKHIGTVKVKYLSSLHFIKNDTVVVVGTWNNVRFIEFGELCKLDKI